MDTSSNIIAAIFCSTNKGLDIMGRYFPLVYEYAGTKKKFRIRKNDKNPSACLTLVQGKDGTEKWQLTDYGDPYYSTGRDGIDVFTHEERIASMKDAIQRLCQMYSINNVESTIQERTEWLPALEGQIEGEFRYAEKPFTQRELKFLAPNGLTAEMCKDLGYHSAEYIERVVNTKNGLMRVQNYSDESHPIFVKVSSYLEEGGEEKKFFKIYRPKTTDKQYKFSYSGQKPTDYINGAAELKKAFIDNGKQKLECAVIVSGERDALCVKAWGYHPLWFNSETSGRNPAAIKQLYQYVKVLFYIPDIDTTGLESARQLQLQILSLQTVYLPKDMLQSQGDQGKPMKDLRDWAGLHPPARRDFENLLNGACSLQLWQEAKGKVSPSFRALKNALSMVGGFYQIVGDADTPNRLVHVDEQGIVEHVKVEQIKNWLTETCPNILQLPAEVREMFNNPKIITNQALLNLKNFDGNYTLSGPDYQIHAFRNGAYKVTKDGITLLDLKDRPNFWKKQVADFHFTQLPPFFKYTIDCDEHGHLKGTVELLNTECNALRFVVNSSRLHWQKEIDYDHAAAEELKAWRQQPPMLDSPQLSAHECREQMDCFLNKIYGIGELMHSYRSPSRARAVMAIDNMVGETVHQANGRTGKSFIADALLPMAGKNVKKIPARSLTENGLRFIFGGVDEDTDIVLLDDCGTEVDYAWFYPSITQGLQIERKCVQAYTLPFEVSPKLAFTTNGVPSDDDPSTRDRFIITTFSDFYHADGGDYKERWSIKDDCGMDIGKSDYPEEERNKDVNFLLQCEQFYLRCISLTDSPYMAPEGNLVQRRAQQECGENLEFYMNEYFGDENHFNRKISYKEFYNWFVDNMPQKHLPQAYKVNKSAKEYCKAHNIIAIPPEMCTDHKRNEIKRNNIRYYCFKRTLCKE